MTSHRTEHAISAGARNPPIKIVSLAEVGLRINRSRWWIRERINAGAFPKPVPIAGRRIGFVEHEIDAFLTELIAQRDRRC